MKTLVRALHGTLSQVVIGALKNNTYYAQVFVQNGDEDVVAIDARPSDAIALALSSAEAGPLPPQARGGRVDQPDVRAIDR